VTKINENVSKMILLHRNAQLYFGRAVHAIYIGN